MISIIVANLLCVLSIKNSFQLYLIPEIHCCCIDPIAITTFYILGSAGHLFFIGIYTRTLVNIFTLISEWQINRYKEGTLSAFQSEFRKLVGSSRSPQIFHNDSSLMACTWTSQKAGIFTFYMEKSSYTFFFRLEMQLSIIFRSFYRRAYLKLFRRCI